MERWPLKGLSPRVEVCPIGVGGLGCVGGGDPIWLRCNGCPHPDVHYIISIVPSAFYLIRIFKRPAHWKREISPSPPQAIDHQSDGFHEREHFPIFWELHRGRLCAKRILENGLGEIVEALLRNKPASMEGFAEPC